MWMIYYNIGWIDLVGLMKCSMFSQKNHHCNFQINTFIPLAYNFLDINNRKLQLIFKNSNMYINIYVYRYIINTCNVNFCIPFWLEQNMQLYYFIYGHYLQYIAKHNLIQSVVIRKSNSLSTQHLLSNPTIWYAAILKNLLCSKVIHWTDGKTLLIWY